MTNGITDVDLPSLALNGSRHPLVLDQSVRYGCNCCDENEFDLKEDFLQRLARLERSVVNRDSLERKASRLMQQHADICPVLLMVIHKVLGSCRHGGHKRLCSERQKRTKAGLQPIELEQADIIICTCRTPPPAGYSQGGLQPLSQAGLTRTEDLSQRIDSLQHSVESILSAVHRYTESMNSVFDRTEHQCKKLLPDIFLAIEETTKDHEDADCKIFDSTTEGVLCNNDLSGRINRLQHSVESLLAFKRDLIHRTGSRFYRLENLCKRAFPEAFLTTMEETTKEHEDADNRILDYTMEDVLPSSDLFQRFNRLQHTVDILDAYIAEFLESIFSRIRNLRIRVRPYFVLALEQIKTRAQGCRQKDLQ